MFFNYHFHFVVSETFNVWGVGIYVKNSFVVHELHHLRIPSTVKNIFKNLWLEIINEKKSTSQVAFIDIIIIIIIDNRGLSTRWCLTSLLLSLPTAAYLGQRGLTPAGLPHTTAQCHLTILGEAVLFCLKHPLSRTPGSLSFCCRPFCRYGQKCATFFVSLSAVGFLPNKSFCTILY